MSLSEKNLIVKGNFAFFVKAKMPQIIACFFLRQALPHGQRPL
jgi:hypothetical protein